MQMEFPAGRNGKIQAVIFDLDGVLMDSEWLAFLAWREVAEAHGARLEDAAFPGIIGRSDISSAEYVMEQTGLSLDIEKYVDWTWKRLLEMLAERIEPLPGAQRLVTSLAGRGLPLAIASNAYTGYIDNALQGLNLGAHFPVRVGADQVTNPKPAPDVYLLAAERLGIDPAHCAAIEDSRVGMQAAASAGMRVVAVPDKRSRSHPFPNAWRVYESLVDVEDELDSVLS